VGSEPKSTISTPPFAINKKYKIRRADGLKEALKKQSEDMTAMMKEMMEMMKKQA